MVTQANKETYWTIVRDCLVRFHGFSNTDASQQVASLRPRIEATLSSDIYYHNEPFVVACNIAGKDLDINDFDAVYEEMLDKYSY